MSGIQVISPGLKGLESYIYGMVPAPMSFTNFNDNKYWRPFYNPKDGISLTFSNGKAIINCPGPYNSDIVYVMTTGITSRLKVIPDVDGEMSFYIRIRNYNFTWAGANGNSFFGAGFYGVNNTTGNATGAGLGRSSGAGTVYIKQGSFPINGYSYGYTNASTPVTLGAYICPIDTFEMNYFFKWGSTGNPDGPGKLSGSYRLNETGAFIDIPESDFDVVGGVIWSIAEGIVPILGIFSNVFQHVEGEIDRFDITKGFIGWRG